jgi:hypothetical protein
MRQKTLILSLIAGLSLLISACGQSSSGKNLSEGEFQKGMAEAIKAAETGKDLLKNARPRRR